jgi:hypothetical protein
MWSNVGNVEEHRASVEFLPFRRDSMDSSLEDDGRTENDAHYLYADCHATNTGLFSGEYSYVNPWTLG